MNKLKHPKKTGKKKDHKKKGHKKHHHHHHKNADKATQVQKVAEPVDVKAPQ